MPVSELPRTSKPTKFPHMVLCATLVAVAAPARAAAPALFYLEPGPGAGAEVPAVLADPPSAGGLRCAPAPVDGALICASERGIEALKAGPWAGGALPDGVLVRQLILEEAGPAHGHGPAHGAAHGPGAHPPKPEAGPAHGHACPGGAHHRFDDPERWAKVFDAPARDAWQKPAELVAALGLQKGQAVADVGAGTGYLNARLAAAVGKKGRVIAIDVERPLVEHMVRRAALEGTPQVTPRLGRFDDPGLLPGEVDLILMVDVYHHVEDREAWARRLLPALRPGGRLVVVDFKDGEQPVGPPPGHKLPEAQVKAELQAAGWALDQQIELLPHQFVLVYRPAAR